MDAAEMAGICKEYSKFNKQKPMVTLCNRHGHGLFAYYSDYEYNTADKLESANTESHGDFNIGVNAVYLKNCFGMFGKKKVSVFYKASTNPIVVKSDGGEYFGMVLPVRLAADRAYDAVEKLCT